MGSTMIDSSAADGFTASQMKLQVDVLFARYQLSLVSQLNINVNHKQVSKNGKHNVCEEYKNIVKHYLSIIVNEPILH